MSFVALFVAIAFAQTRQVATAPAVLVDIARCESGLQQYAPDGSPLHGQAHYADVGIFQINAETWSTTAQALGYDLDRMDGNIKMGLYLYEKYGTRPWTASRSCWNASVAR